MYSPTSPDIYNRISFLGDFRRSIFHSPQQKKNERWARRIFHLACCWTSIGTDVLSKTAFTAARSDLEHISKATFHIRDPQDLEMVDSEVEMSFYEQFQKCLFSSQAVMEVLSSDLITLHPSVVIWSPESNWRAHKGPNGGCWRLILTYPETLQHMFWYFC